MFIAVKNVRGVYEVTGNGPPLVLIASPLARAKTYRTTAESLARIFRVYIVELPGSGQADSVGAGWSVEDYAGWVNGFIAELGLTRPVVIGHSHSGPIGVVLAARYPGVIGHLLLVDVTGTGPYSVVRVFTTSVVDLVGDFEIVLTRWHHVIGNLFLHSRNFVRQVRDALAVDMRNEAARVAVPTLVAWGRRSLAFPPRHAQEYARYLPDATVYLSTTGCHNWLIAYPDEFAATVEAFVMPNGTNTD